MACLRKEDLRAIGGRMKTEEASTQEEEVGLCFLVFADRSLIITLLRRGLRQSHATLGAD